MVFKTSCFHFYFQLFDEKIVDAMEMYRDNGSEWPETALSDYKLILAISFRSSKGALRLVHSSTERKVVALFMINSFIISSFVISNYIYFVGY